MRSLAAAYTEPPAAKQLPNETLQFMSFARLFSSDNTVGALYGHLRCARDTRSALALFACPLTAGGRAVYTKKTVSWRKFAFRQPCGHTQMTVNARNCPQGDRKPSCVHKDANLPSDSGSFSIIKSPRAANERIALILLISASPSPVKPVRARLSILWLRVIESNIKKRPYGRLGNTLLH